MPTSPSPHAHLTISPFPVSAVLFIVEELMMMVSLFQVHYILAELVMGGMVLETNMTEIITRIEEQAKLEKQEVCVPECPLIMMNLTIGGSWHKYNFCGDKFCCDKHVFLSRQKYACDKYLSGQNYVCHGKTFVAANKCLSQQKFCCDKHMFVLTNIILSWNFVVVTSILFH